MAHCQKSDVETISPGVTSGVADELIEALCENASSVIDHYVLAPVTDDDAETLKIATAHQVVAYLQTGYLQNYGLEPGHEFRVNEQRLKVGSHLCYAAKVTLTSEGLTTPWGV